MRSYILLVLLICLFSSLAFAGGGNIAGSGSQVDPYLIEDFNDFQAYCDDPNYWAAQVYTRLICDLDLDPNLPGRRIYTAAIIAPETEDLNIWEFDGTPYGGYFDGNDHVISNLIIDGGDYCGLFGKAVRDAQIANLNIVNAAVSGIDNTGGLVGYNSSNINNCYATGNVTGSDCCTGGLVGYNTSSITNCHATGTVTGLDRQTGGLVGYNYRGGISNCYANVYVSGNRYTGGLVGENFWADEMSNCYAIGDVNDNGTSCGGLVGCNSYQSDIINCYATGNVTGNGNAGGLVGDNQTSCNIINCYSTGNVKGDFKTGGLVASGYGNVINCFWDVESSQTGAAGDNNYGAIGKTTTQMQTQSTFTDAGWDFVNSWGIGDGQTYPYLREYSAADINSDKTIDFIDLSAIADNWLKGI